MSKVPAPTTIRYLGWSGFEIAFADAPKVFIDPPQAQPLAGAPASILLTHGHPEHIGGLRAHLEHGGGADPVTVVAASPLCRYFDRRGPDGHALCHPVTPGVRVGLGGDIGVTAFEWRHLPLLPPGLRAKIRHVRCLMSRPRLAARILRAAASGPRAGPMLGFTVSRPGTPDILVYGEGLHRRTPPGEPATVGRTVPGSVLLAAVEPEDVDTLPDLIAASEAATAVLYEPHAIWRDAFAMPRADLPRLKEMLAARNVDAEVMTPGSVHRLPA